MKSFLFAPDNSSGMMANLGMTALRIFAGVTMAMTHGMSKFPPNEQLISGVSAMGFPLPEVFAWLAAAAELFGGLLIAAGLLTRPAALLLGTTMLVAAFKVHGADPFQAKELSLLYFFICLFFGLRGAGPLSLDRFAAK